MKFILICSVGRSGSTTLQRIINTIEESNINGEFRPGIVHRIDKDTSGIIVVAKIIIHIHICLSSLVNIQSVESMLL